MQELATVESVSVRLETVLNRLSAQFRAMPESKLLGRLPDGRSRAAAGHELAGLLALAAQGVEDRERRNPPTWRALPFEGPFVVGDQIGVTGHDLLIACARGESCADVWAPPGMRGGRAASGDVLGHVLEVAESLAGVL